MRMSFKKVIFNIIILILLIALGISLFNAIMSRNNHITKEVTGDQPQATEKEMTPEEVAKLFTSYMSSEKFEDIVKEFPHAGDGMLDPNSPIDQQRERMPLEEAEKRGLIGQPIDPEKDKAWRIAVLQEQSRFVKRLFGENAWDNVEFTLSLGPGESKEEWVEKATGKVFSPEIGKQLSDRYWEKMAEKEGMSFDELFSQTTEEALILKQTKVIEKYSEGNPIEMKLVPKYQMYKVDMTFNGMAVAPSGESNFVFFLSNKYGKWALQESIQWQLPDNGDHSDI